MPSPHQIDWPGIRAAAVTLGIRAAARQASANLTQTEQTRFVARVLKRAEREGWQKAKDAALTIVPATATATRSALPMSSNVVTGAQSIANSLGDHSIRSKIALARAVTKASEHVAEQEPERILKATRALKDLAGTGSTVHQWEEKQVNVGLQLNILSVGGQMRVSAGEPSE